MKTQRLAIVQPEIPHYRTEFFQLLKEQFSNVDVFTYISEKDSRRRGLNLEMKSIGLSSVMINSILLYNPLPLLFGKYDTLVLMLHFGHVSTWLLLFTRFLHRKRIVLWGQGISVKRYLKEEIEPDWKLKWMIKLASGVWLYMDKEYQQWHQIFPQKPMVALGNSLSGVDEMLDYMPGTSKEVLKEKYGINNQRVYIFCARFESQYRRTDLLIEIIERLDPNKNGFIIIGSGTYKPNFSKYPNVYDFGTLYDKEIKRELFYIADMYLQPGWLGLSIVEAMAYGKPVCTFVRSDETLQCVEYSYVKDDVNGMVFKNMDDCIERLTSCDDKKISIMGENAMQTVYMHTPRLMVEKAISVI